MKDTRFHAGMPTDRVSKSASKMYPHPFTRRWLRWTKRNEVFALSIEEVDGRTWRYCPGGVSCVVEGAYDSLGFGNCSIEWLAARTVRISEELARKLHPEIFTYLESD